MALSILDGNQSATTLSTILSSGQHITAHTVVSLGTQAITDMRGAVSGSVVSISNFPSTQTIAGTVTANLAPQAKGPIIQIDAAIPNDPKYVAIVGGFDTNAGESRALKLGSSGAIIVQELPAISGTVTVGNSVTIGSLPALVAGTAQIGSVTASVTNPVTVGAIVGPIGGSVFKGVSGSTDAIRALPYFLQSAGNYNELSTSNPFPIAGTVTVGNSVTIASLPAISGTVTANLGEVSSIGGGEPPTKAVAIGFEQTDGGIFRAVDSDWPLPISGTVTVGNSVTIGSLPAISGTVTANTFALQGTAVTTSNFTSTTASTVLANYNATREVLSIFNEGAGNLHICAGATCTTIAYQVRLSAGDYYEVPNHQTTITHSAVFATAGTARIVQIS